MVASAGNATTLISQQTEIVGDLYFTGTLEVEGKIKGNIFAHAETDCEIRIRENGFIQGDIRAPNIIINGIVEGDVYSTSQLELAAKGKVYGAVYYHLIEMVMGSELNGTLTHGIPQQMENEVTLSASSRSDPKDSTNTSEDKTPLPELLFNEE